MMGTPWTCPVPLPIQQLGWIWPEVMLWVRSFRMPRRAKKFPSDAFGRAYGKDPAEMSVASGPAPFGYGK